MRCGERDAGVVEAEGFVPFGGVAAGEESEGGVGAGVGEPPGAACGGAGDSVGAIGASEAVGGGLLITGFATLAHS